MKKAAIATVSLMMLMLISGSALVQNNTFRAEVPLRLPLATRNCPRKLSIRTTAGEAGSL